MGIADKLRGVTTSAQESAKNSLLSFIHFSLRFITGIMLGFVLGLIGQELIGYGTFALLFFMVVVLVGIMRLLSGSSIGHILIFDLICTLVIMLLRMYILVAP